MGLTEGFLPLEQEVKSDRGLSRVCLYFGSHGGGEICVDLGDNLSHSLAEGQVGSQGR